MFQQKKRVLSGSKLKEDLHSLLEDSLFDTSPNSSIPFKQHKTTIVGIIFTWPYILPLPGSSTFSRYLVTTIKMLHPMFNFG